MTARVWLLAAGLAAMCGCGQSEDDTATHTQGQVPGRPAPGVAEPAPILFAADVELAMEGTWASEFTIPSQQSIVAAVPVPVVSGIQFVRLDLSIESQPYESYWRAFTADADPPATAAHPTLEGQVPVERVFGQGDAARVLISIPVAGTRITRFRLTGRYAAEAHVGTEDGVPDARGGFVIVLPEAMRRNP